MIAAVAVALAAEPCVDVPGGRGCREDLKGWRILDLHGTDEAIGRAYAALLRDELLGDWVPMIEHMHFGRMPTAFRAMLARHRHHFPEYFDARAANRARGLEQGLDLPSGSVERYAWLADLASIGPGLQLALGRTVQVDPLTGAATDRCTSVVATHDDQTLLARNLDFWGMGYWQPHAALLFVEPLDAQGEPDGHRYAQVGTVGEVFAGSSGINERGLAVTSHLHVTTDAALVFGRPRMKASHLLWEGVTGEHPRGGSSVYVLFERLLRDAGSVEEAIAVLEASPPVGAWSFVLADPTGARAVVGRSYSAVHVARGQSVNTNFYLDPAMHADEIHPARGPLEGARLRYERALALLGDGRLSPGQAADLLRDRFDAAVGRERAVSANSVLSPDTTQSVVLVADPGGDHVLWLADPHADGFTPAPLAPFTAFGFREGFAPGRVPRGELPWSDPRPEFASVADPWLRAHHQVVDQVDLAGAAATLRGIASDDPGVGLMTAWALAATGAPDAGEVLARVDRARASLHHRALADWLEGELAARAGRPGDAEAAWRRGLATLRADSGTRAPILNAPLIAVLEDRLAGGWKKTALPFPDLKFQDVIALRLARPRPAERPR